MAYKKTQKSSELKGVEKLLNEQTSVILSAVDKKMGRVDKRIDTLKESIDARLSITEIRILGEVDKKILASEERINRKIEKLTTTLDKFLKRMTDMEDEFAMMKLDINRLKKVIREKLGVDLL